jgi:hypothetical protein
MGIRIAAMNPLDQLIEAARTSHPAVVALWVVWMAIAVVVVPPTVLDALMGTRTSWVVRTIDKLAEKLSAR